MGQVLTNNTSLRVAYEASVGTLPGSPLWYVVEFQSIGAYGLEISTQARRPISADRGRKKGNVIDADSAVDFETDITIDGLVLFIEGFMFSEFANLEFDLKSSSGTLPPPAVAAGNQFTIDAASALLGGKMVYTLGGAITLVYAKGYSNSANNGFFALAADVASTDTAVQVDGSLVDETPSDNASLQVAGVRTDDVTLTIAVDGTGTLVSAGDVADWTVLGILPGQLIHVGGVDTDESVTNAPTVAATTVYGYVRVTSMSGSTLNFDKASETLTAAGAGSSSGAETVDVLFGRACRNVATTADSDDTRYLSRSHQFEASYPGLGSGGATEYEYAKGNFANELALNTPLTSFATMSLGFIGTDSEDITATRKSGAAAAISALRNAAFTTATDKLSITTDLISSVSDVCFKSLTLTTLNNASPEKCLGTRGARFVNAGAFEFNMEGQMMFTDKAIVNAVRNNTTVTMGAILVNEDGAFGIDVPAMTLGGGGREYPVDESVLVNLTGESFTDPTLGHDVMFSFFPMVPQAA